MKNKSSQGQNKPAPGKAQAQTPVSEPKGKTGLFDVAKAIVAGMDSVCKKEGLSRREFLKLADGEQMPVTEFEIAEKFLALLTR